MASKNKFKKWADWVKDHPYLSALIAFVGLVVAAILIGLVATAVIQGLLPLIGLVVIIPTIFVIGATIYNRFFRKPEYWRVDSSDYKPFVRDDNKSSGKFSTSELTSKYTPKSLLPQEAKKKIITLLESAPQEFPLKNLLSISNCFTISNDSSHSIFCEAPFRFSVEYKSSDAAEKKKAQNAGRAFVKFMQIIFGVQLNLMSSREEYYCDINNEKLSKIINTKEDNNSLQNFYQAWQVRDCVHNTIINWVNKKEDSQARQQVGDFFEDLDILIDESKNQICVKALRHKVIQRTVGNELARYEEQQKFDSIFKEFKGLEQHLNQQFGEGACLLNFNENKMESSLIVGLTVNVDKFVQIIPTFNSIPQANNI